MTLQFAGLKPRTVQSYRRAIRNFFRHLDDEELPVPENSKRLDQCVSLYLEHMWQDDQPITYAGHLMSGLKRFLPELRWRLPRAKQYYANWQSTHVTKQANPFPPVVVMAYAGLAVATRQVSLAALLLVSFLAFLRTGELVSLAATKVAVNTALGRILVALPSTKTSRQREQTVCVEDHLVAKLVAYVLRQGCQVFWEESAASFRSTLKQFAAFFKLEEFAFSAYSLRRGGASHAFTMGTSFDELLVRGRWQSARTARIYLDTGRAALIQQRFSPSQASLLATYSAKLERFCEQLR